MINMGTFANLLMISSIAGIGALIYKTSADSPDESGESDQSGLDSSTPASTFAQVGTKQEAYSGWTDKFSTTCGWAPEEDLCPTKDCAEDCYRLIAQTNMDLTKPVKTGCLDASETPNNLCMGASNVYWIGGDTGGSVTISVKCPAPIWYTDQLIPIVVDIQAYTDCERKTGPNGWAYSHFGRVRESVSAGLTWIKMDFMNPEGLSFTMESDGSSATVETPPTSFYQNITDEIDCRGFGYDEDTKCGGFSRYVFYVRPDFAPEPERMVGNFSLSGKIRVQRDGGDCGFDETYDITVPDLFFVLPESCKDSCDSLGMSDNSNYDEVTIVETESQWVSSGTNKGYKLANTRVDIPDWIKEMHQTNDTDLMETYDTYTPAYLAEESSTELSTLPLITRNSFIAGTSICR